MIGGGVTKKEGSIERTTHLLWPTNPVDWTLLVFSTHTELQTFSHSNCWPTSSILLLPHRSYKYQTKKLSIAFTEYVQSRKRKLSWHQKTHKATASAKIYAQKQIDQTYLFMHLPVHLPPSKLHLCTASTPNFDLTFHQIKS